MAYRQGGVLSFQGCLLLDGARLCTSSDGHGRRLEKSVSSERGGGEKKPNHGLQVSLSSERLCGFFFYFYLPVVKAWATCKRLDLNVLKSYKLHLFLMIMWLYLVFLITTTSSRCLYSILFTGKRNSLQKEHLEIHLRHS